MEASNLPNPVRFGAFEIDRDAGQLTRSGRRVHLAPQALRLLLLLIDKQGNLVTREEIRAALWSGDTFVDVDSAVNACVESDSHRARRQADGTALRRNHSPPRVSVRGAAE